MHIRIYIYIYIYITHIDETYDVAVAPVYSGVCIVYKKQVGHSTAVYPKKIEMFLPRRGGYPETVGLSTMLSG
jgi:hypothetical protein